MIELLAGLKQETEQPKLDDLGGELVAAHADGSTNGSPSPSELGRRIEAVEEHLAELRRWQLETNKAIGRLSAAFFLVSILAGLFALAFSALRK